MGRPILSARDALRLNIPAAYWLGAPSTSSSVTRRSGAATLAAGETQALALDFTDSFFQPTTGFYASAYIKDTTTPANDYNSSPTKAATSLLTYTSPSAKMCMGPNGLLRFGAHNLVTYSEQFDNAAWVKTSATVTANAVAAPDGATTADTLIPAIGVDIHRAYNSTATVATTSASYTLYAKAAGYSQIAIRESTTTGASVIFTLSGSGTVDGTHAAGATITGHAITALPNGWYKLTCTFTFAAITTQSLGVYVLNGTWASGDPESVTFAGDGTSGIYVWGAHLRRTPSDSTYLATTTAARYALPLEWNSAGVLQGLLVEEARTNLCLQSDDLTNASWTKSNLTTAKTATGPDGVANSATTCTATAGNATALQAITSGSSARITSVWLKRRTGTGNIDVTQDNGTTWATQVITSSWARYSIASVTSTNPTVGIRVVTSGDAVDVALFDHEVGAFITSPIPTVSATVTRAIDNINLAVTVFPYGAAGTWSVKALPSATAAFTALIGSNTTNYEIREGNPNTFSALAGADLAVANVALGSGTFADVEANVAHDASTMSAVINGSSVYTDTGTAVTPTTIYVGTRTGNAIPVNGYIQKVLYTPRKVSDGDLPTFGAAA